MHRIKIILLITIAVFLFLSACGEEDPTGGKEVLAKAYDKYFFAEDLSGFPENTSKKDSIKLVKSKIDIWLRKQLMLNKAELNLSDEQKDIKRIVEDYKASLLIDRYKREFLKQKLDTNITDKQIRQYYQRYSESFRTSRILVKAVYVKIANDAEKVYSFRQKFAQNADKDSSEIKQYIKENALIVKDFGNQWIPFSEISIFLPSRISGIERILKNNSFLHKQDSEAYYFIRFDDYKLKGELKPLELVKDKIRLVLINKRKAELIKNLENNIYQSAVEHGNIEIFDNEEK